MHPHCRTLNKKNLKCDCKISHLTETENNSSQYTLQLYNLSYSSIPSSFNKSLPSVTKTVALWLE